MRLVEQAYEVVKIDALQPHPRNPRRGDLDAIGESIATNGFYGAVVAQRSTGYILAGNHRWKAAKADRAQTLPVLWLDVNDEQALRILLADNRTNDLASYDDAELAKLLQEVDELCGLEGTGYDAAALDELLTSLGVDTAGGLTDEDAAPEAQPDPVTNPGDLWILGKHRLLCGDSTVATDVERLLDGVEPHLMVTDPPYGVEYDPDWRNQADRANGKPYGARAIGQVVNDDRADWSEAWALFPGDVAYVWHGALQTSTVLNSLETNGLKGRALIIWAKNQFVISRGDYHNQHEPCWYVVRKGKPGRYVGGRDQSTLWQIDKPRKSETGHSTQKPVECMRRPMLNNSSPGQAVYDPFLGSGTSIIAAETTGRVCLGLEIDPGYCDVIVKRWQDFTGQEATLEPDGKTFNELASERSTAAA